MNKNKKYIFIGFLVIIIFIIVFLSLNKKKELPVVIQSEQNQTKNNLNEELPTKIPIKESEKEENIPIVVDINTIKVSLKVLDKEYRTEIKEGSSVFDTMKNIEERSVLNNTFNFKYKEVSGLGSFVTEINEVKGAPGKYWIYYVNDKLASVGVSKYILKEGDIISWKNEGM